jgi:hypothetical protein
MTIRTPLQQVNDEHGGKEKLVDKLLGLVERGEEAKDDFRARMLTSSNSKLLRLYAVSSEIKDKFGSKEKLVDALLALAGRTKDVDYREKLLGFSPSKLLDVYRARARHAARS